MAIKTRYFLAFFLATLLLDQLSKQLVIAEIYYGDVIPVVRGFFDLTHVRNPGGAFSFFAHGGLPARMAFFLGTTSLAIVLLLVFFRRLEPDARLASLALGSILGGAVGNLVDRMLYLEVIDFLDFHVGAYTWPTFNLADSFIVVGVGILLVEIFLGEGEAKVEVSRDAAGT